MDFFVLRWIFFKYLLMFKVFRYEMSMIYLKKRDDFWGLNCFKKFNKRYELGEEKRFLEKIVDLIWRSWRRRVFMMMKICCYKVEDDVEEV